jgi:hypothetical protein
MTAAAATAIPKMSDEEECKSDRARKEGRKELLISKAASYRQLYRVCTWVGVRVAVASSVRKTLVTRFDTYLVSAILGPSLNAMHTKHRCQKPNGDS